MTELSREKYRALHFASGGTVLGFASLDLPESTLEYLVYDVSRGCPPSVAFLPILQLVNHHVFSVPDLLSHGPQGATFGCLLVQRIADHAAPKCEIGNLCSQIPSLAEKDCTLRIVDDPLKIVDNLSMT